MEAVNNTTLFNQTYMRPEFSATFDTFIVLLGLLIIAINGLVINLFICKPFLQEVTNYFLVSLAVSDGLTGLLVIPLYVGCVVSYEMSVCITFDLTHRVVAFATVYHLLLITCDRYVAITRPFRHSSIFTSNVSIALLVLVWCLAVFLTLVQLTWYNFDNLQDNGPELLEYILHYDIACIVIGFLLPIIIMVVAYTKMLRIITRHARAIEATTREKLILSKEKRATVIFATMLLIYIICWFSFFFFALNADLHESDPIILPRPLEDVLFFFRFCTSVFNPLLYVFFKTDFKKALKETLMHYQCRPSLAGFRLQNQSFSNNDDDSSPPAAPRNQTLISRT